jgi:hypothetical protein
MPAQSVQSFSVAVPFTVQVMTSVAVRRSGEADRSEPSAVTRIPGGSEE